MATALLEIENLAKSFGGIHAVRQCTFAVPEGQVVGLIGPNGAGKSSLLAALGGQVRLAGGSITLDGDEIGGLPAFKRARRQMEDQVDLMQGNVKTHTS